jgi:hypothetical protein
MPDTPLIWTSKGNLPVASLVYAPRWEESDEYIKFSESWSLNGEIVKENAHIYQKRGLFAEPIAQPIA